MTQLKQISRELRDRIIDQMDLFDFMDLSGFDYKAIGHNLINYHKEDEITDDLIAKEIQDFYNA